MEKKIILKDIIKVYDKKVKAINEVSIDIYDKELMVFVGPSGCGKSTLLRMIAGLEDITYGELWIDGVLSNAIQPKDRDIAMVFQNYALYPSLTVYDNIAFGLVSRKVDKKVVDQKVRKVAEQMGLSEYLHRKPLTLSGGQRQRVALCRAIVREPKVFLLDEPLSNLDAKLRGKIKTEIVRLQKSLETTMIYVTHDQNEAMTMADRIVVMKDGYIQQIGTPEDIYNFPANTFVATFIGTPAMNLVNCKYQNGRLIFGNGFEIQLSEEQVLNHNKFYEKQIELLQQRLENKEYENVDTSLLLSYREESGSLKTLFQKKITYNKVKTPEEKKYELEEQIKVYKSYLTEGHPIIFGIRPEDIYENGELASNVKPSSPLKLFISVSELLGSEYHLHMDFMEQDVIAKCKVVNSIKSETYINVVFDLNRIHLFDENNKKAIF